MLKQPLDRIFEILEKNNFDISKRHLKKILETCYVASMEKDEARPVKFRIHLYTNSFKRYSGLKATSDFSFYEMERDFNLEEIVKLSQALSYSKTGVTVDIGKKGPKIRGLFSMGSGWQKYLLFEDPKIIFPSRTLTLSFNSPGGFVAHFGPRTILSFRKGKIEESSRTKFRYFPNPSILEKFRYSLRKTVFFKDVADAKELFSHFLGSLVLRSMKHSHGGTIIFGDPTEQLQENLNIKYSFLDKDSPLSTEELFGAYKNESDNLEIRRRLIDYSDFLAGLTNVDGALVLDYGFRILGFGAEILTEVSKDHIANEIFQNHGTRHRSAFSFAKRFDPGLAIVMSQDGGNKVFFNSNGKVKIIEDLEKERSDFLF